MRFFAAATGRAPYNYQCRHARGPEFHPANPQTLTVGAPCTSRLIAIPDRLREDRRDVTNIQPNDYYEHEHQT